jgi:beta-N-acetylhexosaminidase
MKIKSGLLILALVFSSTVSTAGDFHLSEKEKKEISLPAEMLPAPPVDLARAGISEASPLRAPDLDWVNSTMASMSLDEKIGQMFMDWYSGNSPDQVTEYHLGGFIFSSFNTSGASSIIQAANSLQALATTPLWFAADSEAGAGSRFGDATFIAMNMAHGAADDQVLAASAGWVTGRESWALGIQIGFGPVVDVNTDWRNPIIGTRAYSDREQRVTRLAGAFAEGANRGGMLTCLKHYPGHGPTDVDSHLDLPVVSISEQEFRAVHLYPYQHLIQQGFSDLVMSAHVWYHALDPGAQPWPATLSENAMTTILRDELGFTGVTFSDAFSMAGLSGIMDDNEAVITAINNGIDVILIPRSLAANFAAVRQAVLDEEITQARIDEAVRRILIAKSRCWLPEAKYRNEAESLTILKSPEHLAVAQAVGRASITAVTETGGIVPLLPELDVFYVRLRYSTVIFDSYGRPHTAFSDPLSVGLPNFTQVNADRSMSSSEIAGIVSQASGADRVVVACYDWKPRSMTDDQVQLVDQLIQGPAPVIFASFGSPYHIFDLAEQPAAYYMGYCNAETSQSAMAEVLLGALEPMGTSPVSQFQSTVGLWRMY